MLAPTQSHNALARRRCSKQRRFPRFSCKFRTLPCQNTVVVTEPPFHCTVRCRSSRTRHELLLASHPALSIAARFSSTMANE